MTIEEITPKDFENMMDTAEQVNMEQEFINAYNDLCRRYGYRVTAVPTFVPRDDGTFSVVLKFGVVSNGAKKI